MTKLGLVHETSAISNFVYEYKNHIVYFAMHALCSTVYFAMHALCGTYDCMRLLTEDSKRSLHFFSSTQRVTSM